MEDGRELCFSTSSEEVTDAGAHPMYFAVSCAFVALDLMLKRMRVLELEHGQWPSVAEMMLKGSAQLLGLLVEKAQRKVEPVNLKLKKAQFEIDELKKRRIEDAKANEKVVGIFAAHEQSWLAERKSLKNQIQALVNQVRIAKMKNEEDALSFDKELKEKDKTILGKDEALEEELKKTKELRERLQLAEEVIEELREKAKKEAQDHATELWKHKTAFVELVSSQRHTEAELSRARREVEAVNQELEEAFERKEEAVAMVDKISGEVVKLQKDSEQKNKILSAMLRKSKLDIAEKQMLLKEVKISKAKKKQAELEMERWKNMWESRHKKSFKALGNAEEGCSQNQRLELQIESNGHKPKTLLVEYLEAEGRKDHDSLTLKDESTVTTFEFFDRYASEGNDEPGIVTDNFHRLQDWVHMENEKYAMILEQRHYAEIEAFTEEMSQKDEKLEAFRWRILSMELELKRLQSHIEGLDGNLSLFREENIKLEALLLDKEKELKSSKEQLKFHLQHMQKRNTSNYSNSEACQSQNQWSEFKTIKSKPRHEEEDSRIKSIKDSQKTHKKKPEESQRIIKDTNLMKLELQKERETNSSSPKDEFKDIADACSNKLSSEKPKAQDDPTKDQEEIEEDKEVSIDQGSAEEPTNLKNAPQISFKSSSVGSWIVTKDSSWKMDIHALGVSYKIKRLKQQLLVLEKLAQSQGEKHPTSMDDSPSTPEGSNGRKKDESRQPMKGFLQVKSLLNKQLKRYQSLEEKTDDLCRRMQENYRSGSRRELQSGKTKEKTQTLERFLEETFLLQRYMVATGQKLMEIQSRIASSLSWASLDEPVGFNIEQFADFFRTLFSEVQRGLEVRIARIIGDLEGTLACDGILQR